MREAFQLLDQQILQFLGDVDGVDQVSTSGAILTRRFREWSNAGDVAWRSAIARFVRIPNTSRAQYVAVATLIRVVRSQTLTFSSLRIFGRESANSPYRVLEPSDADLALLERKPIQSPAVAPCRLPLEVQNWKEEEGRFTLRGYYILPGSGASMGGIDWRWTPAADALEPMRNEVFCSNFDCTEQ